ncbi:lactonase family protein [Neobacillus notoginsengisoli]|uniref:Lactonase family protein n=1 Tax=Neobacillus notoginsengisoli TaxID=1578198 RepID=A0A417YZB3_9BACI|nr:lactonase family protein [Neobacillus notoginsengisoli]RHW42850.1 lactonase family protein [Neobacillus notoginsengisoli]
MSKFKGYIGTYTNGDSKGIYSFVLDAEAGAITDIEVAAEVGNPTYLTLSPDRKFLYSVIKEGDEGGVAAFSIKSEGLEFIHSEVSAGSPPCHVSTDSEHRFVFSTNYHKGTVESYGIREGAITSPVSVIHHEGSGPDPRQEKAHTHFAGMAPDGKYLAVCELGCDLVLTYRVNEDGSLVEASRLEVRPGSGPRHLAFHPGNPSIAYVMTEFSSEVIVLSYEDGTFSEIQSISTLPVDFEGSNQGSAIHVSADGRFVYAGNRGHNSIAVFEVDEETGKLSMVELVPTEGDWPRDFAFDPTGKYLIASNQKSSNLVLFARSAESGRLTVLQKDILVPNPVCVRF